MVLAARGIEALIDARDAILAAGAASVLAVPTDVTDPEQVRRLVDRTIERHGRIDILINNAGIIGVGPIETMTTEDIRAALDTNFWGAVLTTLAVLPYMRERGFGRIANVNSIGGKLGVPHLVPYTVSKHALAGWTAGLRAELARDNILVTGVYPGTMRTGGQTHAWFKGNLQAEYTWFGLSDTLPGLSISARRVARRLWEAVCDGEAEIVVGWAPRLAVVLEGICPNELAEVMALVNRLLPRAGSGSASDAPVQGQELRGAIPDVLNRAVPEGTRPARA